MGGGDYLRLYKNIMRDIRFRIFHEGKMYYLKKGDNHNLTFFSEGIPWGLYESSTEARVVSGDPNAILNTPGVLMQFTGLQLNGVDVYEGDVIKFTMQDEGVEFGVVRFSNDGFWTTQDEGHQEELLSDELNSKAINPELVGNIYQHPEILTLNT
jgi:hypothetical protein